MPQEPGTPPSSNLSTRSPLWRLLVNSSAIALMIWGGGQAIAPFTAGIARSQTPAPTSPTPSASPTVQTRFTTLQLGSRGYAVAELQAILRLLGYYTGSIDGQFQASTATAVAAFQQAAGLEPDGVVGLNTWNRLLPAPTATTVSPAASPSATPATPTPSPTTTAAPVASPAASPAASVPSPTTTPAVPAAALSPSPSPTAAPAPSPTASPTPAAASAPVDFPILRLGMRGPAVARLQEQLRSTGVFTGSIDGIFGAQTQAAVQAAQRRLGLTPDGVVGPATWAALLR
jgi:peptidoglycan hydrolase-like protein with peptidoglycan-binding domain